MPCQRRRKSLQSLLLWIVLFLVHLAAVVDASMAAAVARHKNQTPPTTATTMEDVPGVPFLVEFIGRKLYEALDRPKYRVRKGGLASHGMFLVRLLDPYRFSPACRVDSSRLCDGIFHFPLCQFYIYMTIGTMPNEENTIFLLNILCNLLYATSILIGFLLLPRGTMLIGTLVTLFVGPVLVLILLGSAALIVAAFAVYPMASVLSMWLFFFLTSQMAQVICRKLGLDRDKDGVCNLLDLLHFAASTKWGTMIGLPQLYHLLHESTKDPFQEIHRRLDGIERSTKSLDQNLNKSFNDKNE